jgi:hypothetical protein
MILLKARELLLILRSLVVAIVGVAVLVFPVTPAELLLALVLTIFLFVQIELGRRQKQNKEHEQ